MHDNNFAASKLLCRVHAALRAGMSTQEWIALISTPCCICSTSLTGWTKPSVITKLLLLLLLLLLLQSLHEWLPNADWITHCAGWMCAFVGSYICLFVPLFVCLLDQHMNATRLKHMQS